MPNVWSVSETSPFFTIHFGYLHGHPSIVTDAPKLSRQGRKQGVETSTTHWRRKEVKLWPRWTIKIHKMYPNCGKLNRKPCKPLLETSTVYWGWLFVSSWLLPGWAPTRSASRSNSNHRMWNDSAKTRSKGRETSAKLCGSPLRSAPNPCGPCDLSWILGIRTSLANQIMARIGKTQGHPGFGWFWRLFVADLQRHIRYFMEPWSEPKTAELKLEFQTYFRQQLMN